MNRRKTKQIARQIAHQMQQHNGGVVLLSGPMGAGKTTLVGEIVHVLCPSALTSSPTYTVINQYSDKIFHADLYRLWETDTNNLTDETDKINQIMQSIGLLDFCVPGNYVFIEWPHGLKLPNALQVTINVKEDGKR